MAQTPRFIRTLNWYLDTFGMIVSDFQFAPGRRDLGPVMGFIRCDRAVRTADPTGTSGRHTVAEAGARGGIRAAGRQRLHAVEAGRDGEGRPVMTRSVINGRPSVNYLTDVILGVA
jgi:hypothetical protein